MGDDAEYQMERMASGSPTSDQAGKYVYCLIEGIGEEVWHWEPATRVVGFFAALYHERQIGRDCFLSKGIPIEFEIDDLVEDDARSAAPAEVGETVIIDEIVFHIAENESAATHEIIVLDREDIEPLKTASQGQMRSADSLRDKMLAELVMEMAEYMEAEPQQGPFIFAREL